MPGPFPGMDPYLEDRVLWNGIHQGLISNMRDALNAQLPLGYIADIGERVILTAPPHDYYPDLNVFRRHVSPPASPNIGGRGALPSRRPFPLM